MLAFCPVCGQQFPFGKKQHCRIAPIRIDDVWHPEYKNGEYVGFHSRITSKLMIVNSKNKMIMS